MHVAVPLLEPADLYRRRHAWSVAGGGYSIVAACTDTT
jgi:hypothetical protein